ncbi:MAG: MotE family protein [Mesorhizobium sp.]|nr:MotE family protein [Mesorhizobium sp.]
MTAAPTAGVSDEIQRFCGNVADAARDRRYAIQAQELEALKTEIDVRVQQLEAKRAEYEKWMTLRQEFMDHASENVVKIYARMKPDAAAERLAEMKADLAAAILLKLEVKQSGLIMNEMERTVAAKLTSIMASAANGDNPT